MTLIPVFTRPERDLLDTLPDDTQKAIEDMISRLINRAFAAGFRDADSRHRYGEL